MAEQIIRKEYEKSVYVKLDGQTNGFALWLFSSNEEDKFCKDNRGKIKLFKNLDLARSWVANNFGIVNPYSYKVWIMCGNPEIEIDFEDCEKIFGYYEYIFEDTKYFIEEEKIDKVTKLGYIVFENGDEEKTDKAYGKKRSKELFNNVKTVIYDLAKYPNWSPAIGSVGKYNGHLVVKLANCTGKIHIMFISQLMDFNVLRKENEKRCLPFEPNKDKYLCLYIYLSKDVSDPVNFGIEDKLNKVEELIIDYLKDYYPESNPRYIGVEFKGTILIEEEDKND